MVTILHLTFQNKIMRLCHRHHYFARERFSLQICNTLLSLRPLIHLSQLASLRFFAILSPRFMSRESSHAFCLALELVLLISTNYISWWKFHLNKPPANTAWLLPEGESILQSPFVLCATLIHPHTGLLGCVWKIPANSWIFAFSNKPVIVKTKGTNI